MRSFDPLTLPLDGPHLVEASAGTGKTYAITTLYLRLILERDFRVEQILVVTFTEAATAELKDRIRTRIRQCLDGLSGNPPINNVELQHILAHCEPKTAERRLRAALYGFDEAAIFTIHAFCMRMLRDGAFESGLPFDTELITNQKVLLDRIVDDFRVNRRYDRYPFEVAYVDQMLGPAALRRLANQAAENPGILLLPKERAPGLERQAISNHQALYLGLRQMWQDHEAEVRHLLDRAIDEKALSRYSPDKVQNWLQSLDQFLKPDQLRSLAKPGNFEKFCANQMPVNKNKQAPQHPFFVGCQAFLESHERLEASMGSLVEHLKLELIHEVWQRLPAEKAKTNQLYFQDLLSYLDRALSGTGGETLSQLIRQRFPAALIDEFQDTDALQYRIFRRLFLIGTHSLFLIGDPKQAIYSFRGADIFTYLQAVTDTHGHGYTMSTNWRSDPSLIKAVHHLFQDHPRPFYLQEIQFPHVGPRPGAIDLFPRDAFYRAPLTWTFFPKTLFGQEGEEGDNKPISKEKAEREIPRWVAARITTLLQKGFLIGGQPLEPGHIAILVRTNKQAQAVRDALVRCGVPCVTYSNVSIFKTDEAQELALLMRAIVEPSRSQYVKVALCTHILGCGANELYEMADQPDRWEARVKLFRSWKDIWQNQGFIQMFRTLISDAEVHARLFATPDGERAMTNLLHLAELLQEAATREHLGPAGLLAWLVRQGDDTTEEEATSELRLESDARAVAVVTIHRAKGLEYPVVYCPYLWESVDPPPEKTLIYRHPEEQVRVLDVREGKNELALEQVHEEAFAERLRLLYVAVTRARHYLEICWGPFNRCGRSPLGFLLHGRDGQIDNPQLRELGKDEQLMCETLEREVRARPNLWSLEVLAGDPPYARYAPQADIGTLRVRQLSLPSRVSKRNTSFSQLTTNTSHRELLPVRDHDGLIPAPVPGHELLARIEESVPLRDFPKGARAGIFFHSVLEHLDFANASPERIERHVELELRKAGFDTALQPPVVEALTRFLQTPLNPDHTLRLADIGQRARLNEFEFLFPITGTDPNKPVLTAQGLAQVFRQNPTAIPPTYPDQVASLEFTPLCGYMKGFIDLVFLHEDRWYLADYKSNFLGPQFADYAASKLPLAMAENHYYLQYYIYILALHRYLGHVLPDYHYERHFGGVYYLFLKGMDPLLGSDFGVFYDRPPLAHIELLSQLMGQSLPQVGV